MRVTDIFQTIIRERCSGESAVSVLVMVRDLYWKTFVLLGRMSFSGTIHLKVDAGQPTRQKHELPLPTILIFSSHSRTPLTSYLTELSLNTIRIKEKSKRKLELAQYACQACPAHNHEKRGTIVPTRVRGRINDRKNLRKH